MSNEWTLGLLLVVVLLLLGRPDRGEAARWCEIVKSLGVFNPNDPRSPWPPLVRNWATGKVLVSENQVTLDLIDEPLDFGISSIFVFTLDDLGMVDNQCEVSTTNVFFYAQTLVFAGSVRVADNRFSESWMHAAYSGVSIGLMNTTTDNQATHCLLALALLPNMLVFKDNLALVRAFCPNECGERGFGNQD